MSRKLARAILRTKTAKPRRVVKIPKLVMQYQDFALLDKFMRMLDEGEVLLQQGEVVMYNNERELFQIFPALISWCDYWTALTTKQGIVYDDKALRSLIAKLSNSMPIMYELVTAAKEVIEVQRKLFMAVDHKTISSEARTQLVKLAMEDNGIIKSL